MQALKYVIANINVRLIQVLLKLVEIGPVSKFWVWLQLKLKIQYLLNFPETEGEVFESANVN